MQSPKILYSQLLQQHSIPACQLALVRPPPPVSPRSASRLSYSQTSINPHGIRPKFGASTSTCRILQRSLHLTTTTKLANMSVEIDPQELGFHRTWPDPPNSLRTDTEDSSRPFHQGGVASPQDQEPEPYSSCIQGIVSFQVLQGILLTHLIYRSRRRHQNSMRSMRPPNAQLRPCHTNKHLQVLRQTKLWQDRAGQGS